MSSSARIWIIKSNHKVLGPFTTEEVNDSIRAGHVIALDEITESFGRWTYLRDQKTFKTLLREVQDAEYSTITDSGFQKEEDTQWETQENIEDTQGSTSEEDPLLKELEFHEKRNQGTEGVLYKDGPLYSSRGTNKKPLGGWRIWILMSLLLASGAILLDRFNPVKNSSAFDPKVFQNIVEKGLAAERMGDLLSARTFFVEANTMNPNQTEVVLHLVPLLINDYEIVQAEKLLKKQLELEFRNELRKQIFNLIALASIKELKYNKASENLEEALKIDANYIPALFNRSIVSYYLNNYSMAYNDLLRVLELSEVNDGVFVLFLSEIAIHLSEDDNDVFYMKHAEEALAKYLESGTSYIQEVHMMRAYLFHIMGEVEKVQEQLGEMLDSDPMLTQEHMKSPILFRDRGQWNHLFKLFEHMYEDLEKTPHLTAAYGLLSFLGRGKAEGREIVEHIVRQVPDDSLVQAVYSYIQFVLGRLNEARAIVKIAIANNKGYELPLLLQGRYCMKDRDFSCAKEAWGNLLKMEPKNISAIAGLARLHFEEGNFKEAKKGLSEGLGYSPLYNPLLELQALMNGIDF